MKKTAQEMYEEACIPVTCSDAELARMVHSVIHELEVQLEISSGIPEENDRTAIRHIKLHIEQDHITQMQAIEGSIRQFVKAMRELRSDWRELKYHKKYAEVVVGLVL